MARHSNYWFSTTPGGIRISTGVPKEADIVIIGGGFSGISLLYHLVTAGYSNICVLEESGISQHASGRGAGLLSLSSERDFISLLSKYTTDDVNNYIKFISLNNRFLKTIIANSRINCDLTNTGSFRIATTEEECGILHLNLPFIKRNEDAEFFSAEEIQSLMPISKKIKGGIFYPHDITFNPYKLLNELADTIELVGKKIITNASVTEVNNLDTGELEVVVKNRGIIRARQVVYCTNAYTNHLLPEFSKLLKAVKGFTVISEENQNLTDINYPIILGGGNDCIRIVNNRVLYSSTSLDDVSIDYFDGYIPSSILSKMKTKLNKYFPDRKFELSNIWSSLIAKPYDDMPFVGQIPDRNNEYVLSGFGRYSFNQIFLAAAMIRDYIKEGTTNLPAANLFTLKGRI